MLNHSDKNLESSESTTKEEIVGDGQTTGQTEVQQENPVAEEKKSSKEVGYSTKVVIESMDKYFLEDNYKEATEALDLAAPFKAIADKFKAGILISGKIVEKESKGIIVSIDYKSDGLVPSYEFSNHELARLAIGDEIEVMIDALEDADGNLILSYQKAKSIRVWNEITKIYEDNGSIIGRITNKVKGGLNIDIGIPAFLPGSQIDVTKVVDFDQYVGKDVACKIIKINKKRGNVIVSSRAFIEEERNEIRRKSLENLEESQIIRGTVKNITSYGAFVDIGGIDGLLHITDMSWGRISHPSEMVKIGDEVTVKILSFDKENAKISLGIKQLHDNPWHDVDKLFKEGGKVVGKVSAITDYGVFVELAPGVEGLVHISEVSWTERVQDLHSRYKIGDEVEVVILGIEKNERRMSLSIKRKDNDPWKAAFDKFKPGDKVVGVVSNVTDFGVFVRIHPGVDGLVHVSDISWTDHIESPRDRFKKGDNIEVVVLSVEEDKHRISLGIKQSQKDPWSTIENDFIIGSLVTGVVSKVTNFGVFVKFENGIEGLAYVSELSNKEIPDIARFLPVGTKETFKVIKASASERKLGLSLKAVREPQETEEAEARMAQRKNANKGDRSSEGHKQHSGGEQKRHSSQYDYSDSRNETSKGSLQMALEKIRKDKNDDSVDLENK